VLAELAESKLRTGLMITAGSYEPLYTEPMAASFMAIALVLLIWPIYGDWKRGRQAKAAAAAPDDDG
jgi:putative tricarboxylic transport membrane protein